MTLPRVPQSPGASSSKSKPDKNTYLVLRGQKGADPGYDYGTFFLFQGHEVGSNTAPGGAPATSRASMSTPSPPLDGDNEITGVHVSDGDTDRGGILGAKVLRPFPDGWRVFWTQQHGDNVTWEILPAGGERQRPTTTGSLRERRRRPRSQQRRPNERLEALPLYVPLGSDDRNAASPLSAQPPSPPSFVRERTCNREFPDSARSRRRSGW